MKIIKSKKIYIDYSKNLNELISNGNYDFVDKDITDKYFNITSQNTNSNKKILARIFNFGYKIGSVEAIAEMNNIGYRPATLLELLSLGNTYPNFQKKFPIIALGSVGKGDDADCSVPFLFIESDVGRILGLIWFEVGWKNNCCFLAIRK